uniref:Candidate secreted effector n=1 Tax=Meloidogyne incognita TaxID=6306 RepID=A0A914KRF0_MELIC
MCGGSPGICMPIGSMCGGIPGNGIRGMRICCCGGMPENHTGGSGVGTDVVAGGGIGVVVEAVVADAVVLGVLGAKRSAAGFGRQLVEPLALWHRL